MKLSSRHLLEISEKLVAFRSCITSVADYSATDAVVPELSVAQSAAWKFTIRCSKDALM